MLSNANFNDGGHSRAAKSNGPVGGGAHRPQSSNASSSQGTAQGTLWQHPFVDVFKYFKVSPGADWKQNKKQGDVSEIFVKDIGRKAMSIQGSISANNFIQLPHPHSIQKSLGLTGRFLYLQLKSATGAPFSLHFDLGMTDRGHGVRLSVSNLFKSFNQSNGFVVQVPLDLRLERWTIVQLDIVELLARSQLFPQTYSLEGAHQIRGMTLCSNIQLRGVYTSDNEYDFVTLPSDMRFKFPFDTSAQLAQKWAEYFDWVNLPGDWQETSHGNIVKTVHQYSGKGHIEGAPNFDAGVYRQKGAAREQERAKMSDEINSLLNRKQGQSQETDEDLAAMQRNKRSRMAKMPELVSSGEESERRGYGQENVSGNILEERRDLNKKHAVNIGGLGKEKDYASGQYCGLAGDLKRSPKLAQDPIVELRHIIGYSPDRCLNLKWSRFPNDNNTVLFTSGGTLIAMDLEDNSQKRFFFGHSAPICCFDINANGALIASAQEGKNSIIRIWEYTTGRCISMMTMPVNTLKCLAFSYDGKYLASVGKDSHNKELIIVWDITRIGAPGGGKPEIVAKQTADFNILALRFSPIDSSRMASCGKENIRFWRIKDNGSIRGSAVVLNHHARNTVFTCLDFEYGLRSIDPKENEALKRLFVGSKHGMVFQVNYHTESLEATYQTNDGAIFSISVNEAFCVTGSEDTFLRVWPLDFSEFFMEAKHEGTVGAVEISPDGLKVVCGTLNGSLGVLDKSNQKYRTFLRSHTDQILNMDFHLGKRIIITVSKDKTIRLWDISTMDQVYEFSSPVDQALCVAAHPSLPLFSCGFESGVMRVFDIERTCVADEFAQFNKPLTKIAYAPTGDLLVSCCVDGSVALHNPRRQHLPIKMLHIEFPPEFVYVAFTQLSQNRLQGEDFVSDISGGDLSEYGTGNSAVSRFAVMGDYGNCVNVYDSQTFILSHQIQVQLQIKQFMFANNNRELVVMTNDCRVRFYSLARYEGILLREVTAAHRGSISALAVSQNSGYFLTGGEDSMLKVWDYEAQKTTPYYFQAFIGHTYPVKGAMFCPTDNSTIISCGEKDGIYLWNFYGDIRTQFAHQVEEQHFTLGKHQDTEESAAGHKRAKSGSVLEKLRQSKKEAKQAQQAYASSLKEGTFILPQFKLLAQATDLSTISSSGAGGLDEGDETSGFQQLAIMHKQIRQQKGLTYNHFSNTQQTFEVDLQPLLLPDEEGKQGGASSERVMNPAVVGGYDGFGGVHDNIVWHQADGWMVYTLHNKVIFENVKTREQTILCDSASQLSTLALSADKRLLAVGEGRPNAKTGNSLIYLYDTKERSLIQRYTFHQRGVQSLGFSNNGQHLISLGVQGENNLAIWDLQSGLVVRSCLVKNTTAVNAISVDPYVNTGEFIQFTIVGNSGLFNIYKFEIATSQLQAFEVDNVSPEFQGSDFTTVTYSQVMNNQGLYFIILGANDGSMTAFDVNTYQFIDAGLKKWVISGEIAHCKINNGQMVVASSTGTIARFHTTLQQMFPTDAKQVQIFRAEGPVVSLCMDDINNEGLVGTAFGTLFYINFDEKLMIRVVSKAYSVQKPITSVKFCEQNPQLILSNLCNSSDGNGSGIVKVWTTQTLDQVMRFSQIPENSGPAVFVLSGTNGGKYSIIGHQLGLIRLINIECLRIEAQYRIPLATPEEYLTAAVFNPNGVNFAIGTSHGSLYLGSLREDAQNKPKLMVARLEPNGGLEGCITSLEFSAFDPIGSFLVTMDNGTVKTWQTSVRNEQFLKLLEIQQRNNEGNVSQQFDLSEVGYQQFDLIDTFDMFENPHGLDEVSSDERAQLRVLYGNKRYRQCAAHFSPSKSSVDIYFSYVSALQYIYVRNYIQNAIVKRVSLMHFPTCFSIVDFNELYTAVDHDDEQSSNLGGEQVLALVGTKEGKLLTYKIASSGSTKLAETRGGLAYGSISALDVSAHLDRVVAATESGELFTAEILPHLQQQ